MNNITTGLLEAGHEVKVISIVTNKHPYKKDEIPSAYHKATRFQPVFIDTSVNIVDAFSNLITADSYNISRFFSTDFDIALSKLLKKEKFDVVILESLFTTPYLATIKRFSKSKIILRSHNLEYIIWQRMARGTGNKFKRAYVNLLARQLKEYEFDVMNNVDGIAAISQNDELKYKRAGCKKPIRTISFGIDIKAYQVQPEKIVFPSVFHLGSMDWTPNQEAMQWFLEEVWPKVINVMPDLQFYLAGRSIPEYFYNNKFPNTHVIGEVFNAIEFMNSKSIMVVPLLSAGGVRVKIIEGMALAKAIVSTTIGAEGISIKKNQHILIANEAEDFANKIIGLARDREKTEQLGRNARLLAENKFDNTVLSRDLINFIEEL